jgi:hypothetical protein
VVEPQLPMTRAGGRASVEGHGTMVTFTPTLSVSQGRATKVAIHAMPMRDKYARLLEP